MFGIGPTELIVILVIALLILGPKRLPELARSLGRGLAEFRRATSDVTSELDNARIMLEEETREAAHSSKKASDKKGSEAGPAAESKAASEPSAETPDKDSPA